MSAEQVIGVDPDDGGTANVDEAMETEARDLGWVPKDKFRGNIDHWTDAKAFVENGRRIMPLLKKQNERLSGTVKSLQSEMAQIRADLAGSKQDFDALQEQSNEELKRRAEDTRRQILSDLKKAKEAGDTDSEIDLTEQLGDVKGVIKDLNAVQPEKKTAPGKMEIYDESKDEDYQGWVRDNPWFSDPAKKRQALAIALVLRDEDHELIGRAFYEKLDERIEEAGINIKEPRRTKVSSGQGGAGTSTKAGHTYADLTSEAKSACDGYASKFVKENGRFKTVADYRKHYVAQLEEQGATEFFR